MFTCILLTNPAAPALNLTTADALRSAWGGGDLKWLSLGEAAEFSVETVPSNHWDVWEGLQTQGIDLIVVPTEARRKKMLLADMDSTMIQQECIDELADVAGVGGARQRNHREGDERRVGFRRRADRTRRAFEKACRKASSKR